MRHLETDHYWLWSRNKFVNRKYLMQEMYQNYVESEAWEVPEVTKHALVQQGDQRRHTQIETDGQMNMEQTER